jgi:hypothetical protein
LHSPRLDSRKEGLKKILFQATKCHLGGRGDIGVTFDESLFPLFPISEIGTQYPLALHKNAVDGKCGPSFLA